MPRCRAARCILSKFYIKPQPEPELASSRPGLYLIEILHQTTTRHRVRLWLTGCILSKFYIKPQRIVKKVNRKISCILSKFYIKPQHSRLPELSRLGCILSKFYIKPQQTRLRIRPSIVVSYRNSTSNHNTRPRRP